MDGRKNNGGKRANAGRKSKKYEVNLKKLMDGVLSPEEVFSALSNEVLNGDVSAIKTWLEYYYGRPKQSLDVTTKGESMNQLTAEQLREKSKQLDDEYK